MYAELLKACSFCGKMPKLSSMSAHKTQYNYSCCRVGQKSDSESEAAYRWNLFNLSSPKTYQKNNQTGKWELLETLKEEPKDEAKAD